MKKAVALQYDSLAVKKGFKSAMEWEAASKLKKYRGCVGDFYSLLGVLVAIAFWAALALVVILGPEALLALMPAM